MNSVLYHLHPVKVKRHAVKVSYTLCLGGLSFFLFILLTVTGIFLMFFYRPEATAAWNDISNLQTSVTFGLLVRNMHRWGAHLMVITVFLHMARVFYHGAYKPPREFNWVIGVILLTLTLLLSFTGYLLPWDQLALWAVTVGTNMIGYTPGLRRRRCASCSSAAPRSGRRRCCGGTCSTCCCSRSSSSSSWRSTSGASARTADCRGRYEWPHSLEDSLARRVSLRLARDARPDPARSLRTGPSGREPGPHRWWWW